MTSRRSDPPALATPKKSNKKFNTLQENEENDGPSTVSPDIPGAKKRIKEEDEEDLDEEKDSKTEVDEAKGVSDPHDNDVLCGRGGSINTHPGNELFRKYVERHKRVYLTARFKREKRLIANSIVKEIRSLDPPGRFLARNSKTGLWHDIGDEKARDKTSQALRENAPIIRREIEVENDARRAEMAREEEERRRAESAHRHPYHPGPWGSSHPYSQDPYMAGAGESFDEEYDRRWQQPRRGSVPPSYGDGFWDAHHYQDPHKSHDRPSYTRSSSTRSAFDFPRMMGSTITELSKSSFSFGGALGGSSNNEPPQEPRHPDSPTHHDTLPHSPPHSHAPASEPGGHAPTQQSQSALKSSSYHSQLPSQGRHSERRSVSFQAPEVSHRHYEPGSGRRLYHGPVPHDQHMDHQYNRQFMPYARDDMHYDRRRRFGPMHPRYPPQDSNYADEPQELQRPHHSRRHYQGQFSPTHLPPQMHRALSPPSSKQGRHDETMAQNWREADRTSPYPSDYHQQQGVTQSPSSGSASSSIYYRIGPSRSTSSTRRREDRYPPMSDSEQDDAFRRFPQRARSMSPHSRASSTQPFIGRRYDPERTTEGRENEQASKRNPMEVHSSDVPQPTASPIPSSMASSPRPHMQQGAPEPEDHRNAGDKSASSSLLTAFAQNMLFSWDSGVGADAHPSEGSSSNGATPPITRSSTSVIGMNDGQASDKNHPKEEDEIGGQQGQEVELIEMVDSMEFSDEDNMNYLNQTNNDDGGKKSAPGSKSSSSSSLRDGPPQLSYRDSEVRTPPPAESDEAVDLDWPTKVGGCHTFFKESLAGAGLFSKTKAGEAVEGTGEVPISPLARVGSGSMPVSPVNSIPSVEMDGLSMCGTEVYSCAGSVGGGSLCNVFDGDLALGAGGQIPALPDAGSGGRRSSFAAYSRRRSISPPMAGALFNSDQSLVSKGSGKSLGTSPHVSLTYSRESGGAAMSDNISMGSAKFEPAPPEQHTNEEYVWSWDGKSGE